MSDDVESRQDLDRPQPAQESSAFLLDAKVALRREGDTSYRVRLHHVSRHGCNVEFVVRPRLGERVWVKFEGLEAVGAVVRRLDEGSAALEFHKPIHPAVFDLLMAKLQRV